MRLERWFFYMDTLSSVRTTYELLTLLGHRPRMEAELMRISCLMTRRESTQFFFVLRQRLPEESLKVSEGILVEEGGQERPGTSLAPAPLLSLCQRFEWAALSMMLQEERLTCALQPIVNGRFSSSEGGHEALLRCELTPEVCVSGASLFQIARRYGMQESLERLALRLAVHGALAVGLTESLFINTSPIFINTMLDELETLCGEDQTLHLPLSRVVLELTEGERVDPKVLLRARERARRMGVRIAMDDVGQGIADLWSLHYLRPDVIKIDRALITDVHLDPVKSAMVESLLRVSQLIGADTIAEGVEVPDDYFHLKKLGIPLFQGYLLARPRLVRELTASTNAMTGGGGSFYQASA
jgi:EAL domain-containing protein (putative c-di-GMP-specific phosphodiesterase class I)